MLNDILSNSKITAILSALGGIGFTLIAKLGDAWIKEKFKQREQRRIRKIKAAEDINLICNEGFHKSFRYRAESEQKYKLKALNIESIDKKIGLKLRKFINNWIQCRNCLKRNPIMVCDESMAKEYRDKAQKLGDELLEVARKWGK